MPAQAPAHAVQTGSPNLPSEDEIKEDPRACYQSVRQQMDAYSAAGREIPEDLKRVERAIQVECMAQSQGR